MQNIPVAEPYIKGNEKKYVDDVIKSSWVSGGKYVESFEKEFAKFCEVKYATSVVNGTAALHLLFHCLGIGQGDEVIVPDLTFVASANAVTYTGAKPIFIDADRNTWNIDPYKIEEKITYKTKAILAVHLYGYPSDMDPIKYIANKHNLVVIEDACEAIGATYKGKKTGSLGEAACFSFYGNKTITTGEGGMIVSNDEELIKKCNYLKSHAQVEKGLYRHTELGFNYRFTNLQAAFGLAQLENIDYILKRKKENARIYNEFFKDEDILIIPPDNKASKNSFWMYSIVTKKENLRDKLMDFLASRGIQTRPFFIPMHRLPMYKTEENFPSSDFLSKNGLSLPSSATLTEADIDYICSNIKEFIRKSS